MNTSTKRAYASHVSRFLASAGFERSDWEATSIVGHRRYSPGFEVIGTNESWEQGYLKDKDGTITVHHQAMNSFDFGEKDPRPVRVVAAEAIESYAGALESGGYLVEIRERSGIAFLAVTGRTTRTP